MRLARKSAAGILLAALLLFISVPAFPTVQTVQQAPAGCHGHGHKAPAPASYRCCVAGHQTAVVQPTLEPGATSYFVAQFAEGALKTRLAAAQATQPPQFSSTSPPDVTALRI